MGKTKKGAAGTKKKQGAKAASILKAKREAKHTVQLKKKVKKSKAVERNLKKMSFNNSKKIELLNSDITNVLMAPAKAKPSPTKVKKAGPPADAEMPDVSGVANMMSTM